MGTGSVLYRIILVGHLIAAVVGFGGLITHGLYHARAVRAAANETGPLMRATVLVSKFAHYAIYAVFAFGIILISLSDDAWSFAAPWVSASFVVWFVIVGLIHGLVRPAQRRLQELATRAENDPIVVESCWGPALAVQEGHVEPGAPDDADPRGSANRPSLSFDQWLSGQPGEEGLLGRLAMGELATQVLFVVALILMVWKPGN